MSIVGAHGTPNSALTPWRAPPIRREEHPPQTGCNLANGRTIDRPLPSHRHIPSSEDRPNVGPSQLVLGHPLRYLPLILRWGEMLVCAHDHPPLTVGHLVHDHSLACWPG